MFGFRKSTLEECISFCLEQMIRVQVIITIQHGGSMVGYPLVAQLQCFTLDMIEEEKLSERAEELPATWKFIVQKFQKELLQRQI